MKYRIISIFFAVFGVLPFFALFFKSFQKREDFIILFFTTLIFSAISFVFSYVCNQEYLRLKKSKEILDEVNEKLEKLAEKRMDEEKNFIVNNKKTISSIEKDFDFFSISGKSVGGSWYSLNQDQKINFGISKKSIIIIKINDSLDVIDIPFEEINEVEISGPGTVVTDAGMSGGGFGLEGFIKGAAAAALINAATTRKTTNTFMRIMTATGEIYIHTSEIEPDALKIKFSPVFVYLKNKANQQFKVAGSSIAEEIERLQKLFKDGILTQEEFDAAKKKVIS